MRNQKLRTIFFIGLIGLLSLPAYAGIPRKDLVSYTLDYYANETSAGDIIDARKTMVSIPPDVQEQQNVASEEVEAIPEKTISVTEKKENSFWQQENITKIRRFLKDVTPYLKVTEEWTDNTFYDNDNQIADFVTKINPGIELKNKISKRNIDYYLTTGTQFINYVRNYSKDTQLPYFGGFLKYNNKDYGLSVKTNIHRVRAASGELETPTVREFIDSWSFDYNANFETSFKKLKWGLQYYYNETAYQQFRYIPSNSNRNALAFVGSLQVTPKTYLIFDYAHGWLDIIKSKSSNWTYNKYWLGVSTTFNKLGGSLKYGYRTTDPAQGKKYAGPTVKMRINYQQTPRLTYQLDVVNGMGESELLDAGTAKIRGIALISSYMPLFNKRLRFNTGIGYKEQDSEPDTRDKYFFLSLRPEYKLKKWLSVGLGYTLKDRTSNIMMNRYKNNTIDLQLTSEF